MSYTEISEKEFEEVLTRQGYKLVKVADPFSKENIYLIESDGISIKVYSSLVGGISREVGADAIRTVGWDPVSNLPVMASESRVYRTEGWRENLVARIEGVKEKMKGVQKCGVCGGILVERVNSKTREKFMGCLNWKNHQKKENKVEEKPARPIENRVENKPAQPVENRIENKSGQQAHVVEHKAENKTTIIDNSGSVPKLNIKIPDYSGLRFCSVVGDESLLETNKFQWGKFGFDKFNPIQSKVAEVVPFDNNVVIEAKTSTGKTQMGEMFMWHTLGKGKTVIYTSPLKALTREKFDSWQKKFAGFKIAIVTGDYRLTDKRIKELNEANIILCTSEMLDHRTRNMASEKSEWLKKAGLLILDEVQMIGQRDRGDKLEAGLMRFTLINPECRLTLLSGTMPNSGEIAKWVAKLNGKETVLVKSDWRPIKLNMRYEEYKDDGGYYAAKDSLLTKVMEEVKRHEKDKILIFVHSKTDGRRILTMLNERGYKAEFHNADLEVDDRVNIEESFKSRSDESVRIIIATSTLAYGLNLPARIVIITGVHRGIEEVSELDIIQMCGRSGRMGIDTEGDAIVLLPETQFDELKKKIENPGDIISQISNPLIAGFHIIGEVVNKTVKTREDVYKWYGRTLAARQNMEINKEYVNEMIDYLLKNNAIRDVGGQLVDTELGKAAVYFYLRPDMIKDLMVNWSKIFDIKVENNDFMATLAMSRLRMYDNVIVSKAEKGEIENYFKASKAVESVFGGLMEGQSKIGVAYLNMFKGIGGTKIITEDGKEKKVGNPLVSVQRALAGDIERVMQALMYIDAKYTKWNRGTFWNAMAIRIKYGVGPELVGLCTLEGVGGAIAKKLYDAGVKQPFELVTKKMDAIAALGVRYYGILNKNKNMFEMMGYKIESRPVTVVADKKIDIKDDKKENKIDESDILKFPS